MGLGNSCVPLPVGSGGAIFFLGEGAKGGRASHGGHFHLILPKNGFSAPFPCFFVVGKSGG